MKHCEWLDCDEKNIENLQDHLKIHADSLGEPRCLWVGCSRFNDLQSNKYTFATHLKCHYGIKPFSCNFCKKEFARMDALNKHSKRHEREVEERRLILDKIFHSSSKRDYEIERTTQLLEERQFQINIKRILEDEFLSLKSKKDDWDDYLN